MGVGMFFQHLLESKLYWWQLLAHLALALIAGIIVANYLYRGVSWESMNRYDYWSYTGGRGTGLEAYLLIIVVITFICWFVLNQCAMFLVGGFQ